MYRSASNVDWRNRVLSWRPLGCGLPWRRGSGMLDPVGSDGWFEALVEHASDAMIGVDAEQKIRIWNVAATEMFGFRNVDIMGQPLSMLLPEGVRQGHHDLVRSFGAGERERRPMGQDTELRALRQDGSEFPVEIAIAKIPLGGEVMLMASVRDVSEKREVEQALAARNAELARLALHDSLTGLPNRTLLLDRLDRALGRSASNGGVVSLLYLDLDHFKHVNDRLGHDAGDRFLIAVAKRITGAVRAGDTVARLGGDEFAVLLERPDDADAVVRLAQRLIEGLHTPVEFGQHEVRVTASIGVVSDFDGSRRAVNMLRHADTAMYHAKGNGRDRFMAFDMSIQAALEQRLDTEAALRDALTHDQFEIHYQPVVDLLSGTIVGVEALLRWDRPGYGPVSPALFIPVAEDVGLIDAIGEWVLRRVCAQAVDWQERHSGVLQMAVNISARQLSDRGFAALAIGIFAETGVDPKTLTFEVTETAVIDQSEIAITNLHTLRARGVEIALDDFGTGYSSLAYLRNLPITHIKIDRSFTAGLSSDLNDAAIVESTIALAHKLELVVIAEGVETATQLEILTHCQCDQAQGYLLGRPQPASDIEQLLGASFRSRAP